MSTLQQLINRRTFLKIMANLSALVASTGIRDVFTAQNQQQDSKTHDYGVGNYSQGEYPGYKTYLPLVSKENK